MSRTAGADGIFLQNLVEDVDYLPDDSEKTCLMAVAGAIICSVITAVCAS